MPTWKKVVVSGSGVSQLANDANYLIDAQTGAILTGSFSGSFKGDGSGLTGIASTLSFTGDTGNDTLNLKTESLTIDGASGIATSVTDNTITIDAAGLSGSAHTQRLAIQAAGETYTDTAVDTLSGSIGSLLNPLDNRVDALEAFSSSLDSTFATDAEVNSAVDTLSGSAHTQRVAIESGLSSDIDSLSGSAHTQRLAIESGLTSDISSLSGSAHTQRLAIESGLTSDIDALSGSAHTQRVAIETSLDGKIDTEKGRIDAILSASTADADSFKEIVDLINSVDTTNDQAFAAFYTSSNNRLVSLETTSGSHDIRITDLESFSSSLDSTFATNVELSDLSSSAHTQRTGIESGLSSDIDSLSGSAHTQRLAIESGLTSDIDSLSGSAHTQRVAIESGLSSDIGTLSGSAHTQRTAISGAFASTISNLSQTLSISGSTGDADVDLKTQDLSFVGDGGGISTSISGTTVSLVSNGVVSGSSQVTISDTTGYTAFSQSIDTHLDAKVSSLSGDIDSLSGSAHTQRLAIETSLDGKINTEKGRIDAILTASSADADSFAEIVALINSVDTTNDQVFAGYATASNARFDALETTSGSHDIRITDLENFSSSLNSTFATDAELASLSSSAHTQRLDIESGLSSDIDSLSGSAHTQRLAIESGLSSDIGSLSGSAHIQRVALDSAQTTALSNVSGAFATSQATQDGRLNSLESFTASLDDTFATDAELNAATASVKTYADNAVDTLSGSAHTQRVAIESGLSSDIDSLSGSAHIQRLAIESELSSDISSLSGSAHTQRLDIESGLSSDINSLSGSAHTQRVAIETSLDGKIDTEKGRIDAILSASTADADSFKEIVDLINSVDTTNDQAFAAFYTASNNRLDSLETDSGSQDTRIIALESFSSSLDSEFATDAEVTSLSSSIATTLSGLSQTLTVNGDTGTDGVDLKTEALNIEGDGGGITTSVDSATNTISLVSNGIVSSSAQTVANLVGEDIVADSFTGDGSQLTNLTISQTATVISTFTNETSVAVSHNFGSKNVLATVYEGDTQIIPASVTTTSDNVVTVTFDSATSGRVIVGKGGHIVSGSVPFANILNKPTLISGSEQVVLGDVNGFTAYSSSVEAKIAALDDTFATDTDLSALSSSAHTQRLSVESGLTSDISNLSGSAHTQRVAIETSLQSNIDGAISTANSELNASSSALTTAYTAADTALSSSIATTISNLSSTISISGSTGNSDVNLVTDDLSIVGVAGQTETTVAGTTVSVGFVTNPTVSGNLTVTGDLTVTGNTFEAQVTNLNVEDRFILINSGSNTGDAGIIFGGSDGTANVGSGIFFDNPAGVFGFAQGIGAADTSATHQSKIGNIETSATTPSTAPTFQGVGSIHVDTSTEDIYIYS